MVTFAGFYRLVSQRPAARRQSRVDRGTGLRPARDSRFVLDEETPGIRLRGAASRWWLHHSLRALDASLRSLGSRLILRRGAAERVIGELAHECDASAVYWNRAYDPGTRDRDTRISRPSTSVA